MQTHDQAVRFNVGGIQIDARRFDRAEATGCVVRAWQRQQPPQPAQSVRRRQLHEQGSRHGVDGLADAREERADQFSGHLRFDISFLARRVMAVVDELREQTSLPLGLFGASTGAAAALVVAAARPEVVSAVVSRGGRPDLAGDALATVKAPTLLIVGSEDHEVVELNRKAVAQMTAESRIEIVPGASHLFHEPGALETVAHLAADWFTSSVWSVSSSIVVVDHNGGTRA